MNCYPPSRSRTHFDAAARRAPRNSQNRQRDGVVAQHRCQLANWSRIHIDHAGPFMGKIFLVLVGGHSKWMDVHIVPSTNSSNVISILRSTFATHGLPELVVSDNGSAFTSLEFCAFPKKNEIKQITSAPYHPATNGIAERAVQTETLLMWLVDPLHFPSLGHSSIIHYRTTPHSTTALTPAEMLMGRPLRTHLYRLTQT